MMKPGYYLALGETVLRAPEGPYKVRIHRDDWIVTNGTLVGRFDQVQHWEWFPLEWSRNHMLVLTPELARQIDDVCIPTTFTRLEARFRGLSGVEREDDPDEPFMEMPRPPLREGLGTYLKARRSIKD